jgi:hypothetical protein
MVLRAEAELRERYRLRGRRIAIVDRVPRRTYAIVVREQSFVDDDPLGDVEVPKLCGHGRRIFLWIALVDRLPVGARYQGYQS